MPTRRAFLGGLAATIPLPAAAALPQPPETTPTTHDLDRYYSFLWLEFIALSKEMGVEVHSNAVLHRSGGHDAYQQSFNDQPPSTRAKAVLALLGT